MPQKFCSECGTNVEGKKFCVECGTKVAAPADASPPKCPGCGVFELVPGVRYCPDCGYNIKENRPATPPPSDAHPQPQALPPSPRATPPAPPVEVASSSGDVYEEAAHEEEPSSPRAVAESVGESSPADMPKKKVFSVKAAPKCHLCARSVYKTEEVQDAQGTVFHKECLRCKQCKTSLLGREPVPEEKRVGPIRTAQYLIAKEGSRLGDKGDLFCEKHAIKAGDDMVTGKKADEISRDDNELKRLSALVKDKKDETRASMELRVGDSTPVCSRCGYPIDPTQEVIASGIQRFHAACPSKEEAEKQLRTIRYFVKRLPDRLVVQLAVDSHTNYTFLYEVDREALNGELRKKSHEPAKVVFLPDKQAHASTQRKLPDHPSFDMVFKDFVMDLDFKDPVTGQALAKPAVAGNELVLVKFHLSNGVRQRVDARFKVEGHMVSHVDVVFSFEHYPALKEDNFDPLTRLKATMSDAGTVEVDLVAEAKARAQEALGHS